MFHIKSSSTVRVKATLTVAIFAIAFISFFASSGSTWGKRKLEFAPHDVETVRRLRLDVAVNAPGVIESSSNTRVECKIERLQLRVQGRSLSTNGSTRILTIVPDGSMVKKDDVICTLDSSQFQEMVYTQLINVERAKAEQLQAQMELDVAKIALEEYRNGTAKQQVQTLMGQIALAQTDSSRLTSRLEWARKMFQKGYLSRTAIQSEEFSLQRSDIQLSNSQISLKTFERFTKPKIEHQLRTRIISLERELASETESVERFVDRLELYKKMIENCTIRAPHDGMLIYANDGDRNVRIEEGVDVREGQTLFYLPDLNRMQVMARLSESVVKKVAPGMKVLVEIESLTSRTYHGTIDRISQFPMPPSSWRASQDVKNYFCVVRIDDVDGAIRPGLNAEIQVLTDLIDDSIVLSPNAVTIEGDQEFCYVMLPNGNFEKREIRTRTGDPSTLEVLEGLEEGEVVLRSIGLLEKNPGFVSKVALLRSSSPESEQLAVDSADNSESLVLGRSSVAESDTNSALPAVSNGY